MHYVVVIDISQKHVDKINFTNLLHMHLYLDSLLWGYLLDMSAFEWGLLAKGGLLLSLPPEATTCNKGALCQTSSRA
jgi:hypothetical protein